MKFRLNTLRDAKGFRINFHFAVKRTHKDEVNGLLIAFIGRRGIELQFGPEYLIG